MVNSLEKINGMLESSDINKAIDRHAANVFNYFPYNPKTKHIKSESRTMCVSDDAISWLSFQMEEMDNNMLKFNGGDGTF
jgi:hypothetical protein